MFKKIQKYKDNTPPNDRAKPFTSTLRIGGKKPILLVSGSVELSKTLMSERKSHALRAPIGHPLSDAPPFLVFFLCTHFLMDGCSSSI
jgi:hypothetical protein